VEILPDFAQEAFTVFKEVTTCPQHKALLCFCAVFGITWITSWTLSTAPLWEEPMPQQLIKKYSVKWWSKFNPDLISPARLNAWFSANPSLCKETQASLPTPVEFSAIQPQLLESLKNVTNPQDFMEKLKEAMSVLSDNDSTSITSTADNQNEDDCYGVLDL
jgi:hypothetical protein